MSPFPLSDLISSPPTSFSPPHPLSLFAQSPVATPPLLPPSPLIPSSPLYSTPEIGSRFDFISIYFPFRATSITFTVTEPYQSFEVILFIMYSSATVFFPRTSVSKITSRWDIRDGHWTSIAAITKATFNFLTATEDCGSRVMLAAVT